MWLLFLALAHAEIPFGSPYYCHVRPIRSLTADDVSRKMLADWALAIADRHQVRRIDVTIAGKTETVLPAEKGSTRMRALPTRQVVAIYGAIEHGILGGEWDVLVKDDGEYFPITVWWEGDHVWTDEGAPIGTIDASVDLGTLVARHPNLHQPLETDGAQWSEASLGLLDAAFAHLSDEEARLVADVPFRRTKNVPKGMTLGAEWAGLYATDDAGHAWIAIFDYAFDEGDWAFVGPVTAPSPYALFTLLHEIGHALAHADARNQGVDRQSASSPVFQRFAAVLGDRHAPTKYGDTAVDEAFAECFALYKLDADALRRLLPDVLAWFEAGGHLHPV